jgi:hypothetical protein
MSQNQRSEKLLRRSASVFQWFFNNNCKGNWVLDGRCSQRFYRSASRARATYRRNILHYWFSGTAKDTGGNPVTGVTGITFALYAEQIGGAPLWSETQSVQAGAGCHYTVLLGAAKSEGLQADLFTAEQAHWAGVSVEGQALGDFPTNSLTGALEISPDGHKVMVSANDYETGYELWSLENFELPRRSSDPLLVGQTIGLCRLPTLSESGRPRKAMVCPTDENTYSFGW